MIEGTQCDLAAIAVVLVLEDYQTLIAKNLRAMGCPCTYDVDSVSVYWRTPR